MVQLWYQSAVKTTRTGLNPGLMKTKANTVQFYRKFSKKSKILKLLIFLGSVRTLSDKYQKPIDAIDDGLISHVSSLPTASGSKGK